VKNKYAERRVEYPSNWFTGYPPIWKKSILYLIQGMRVEATSYLFDRMVRKLLVFNYR
jgi:hypothetical protein